MSVPYKPEEVKRVLVYVPMHGNNPSDSALRRAMNKVYPKIPTRIEHAKRAIWADGRRFGLLLREGVEVDDQRLRASGDALEHALMGKR